ADRARGARPVDDPRSADACAAAESLHLAEDDSADAHARRGLVGHGDDALDVDGMLEVKGLTKRYAGLLAVDKVSFTVNRGEVVGYLGPHGSGKSTTVNIVVGLLEPSGGQILLDGRRLDDDPEAYKARIGYVPEE